jgi:hypothetical protein
MTKGILYYTSNLLNGEKTVWGNRVIEDWVKELLLKIDLPIVSVSLKPIELGKNIVLDLEPSIVTMHKQIMAGLEATETDVVFFCEHDILYHPSHFLIDPQDKDTFYYNENSCKWDYTGTRVVWHNNGAGLHGMCGYTDKLREHYKKRLEYIYEKGIDKLPVTRNPRWARDMGYEPGKPKHQGGISNDKREVWMSQEPIINIRHSKTVTPRKMQIDEFIKKPTEWKELDIKDLWINQ